MMEFDDFSDKKTETELIMEKREKIKERMSKKLQRLNFSEEEVGEVMVIIDETENKIEKLKTLLIGTNINVDDPTPVMNHIINDIRILQAKMSLDIKAKIAEILRQKLGK